MILLSEEIAAAVRLKKTDKTQSVEIKPGMVSLDFNKGVNSMKKQLKSSKNVQE